MTGLGERAHSRETAVLALYPHARAEAEHLVALLREHPEITEAAIAGDVRRYREVASGVTIVACCHANAQPEAIAASFTRIGGVKSATGEGTDTVEIHFVDGVMLRLRCVLPEQFAVALWRATGSAEHVELVRARLAERGILLVGDELRDNGSTRVPIDDEKSLYRAADLDYIEPELREAEGEIDAAARRALPRLLERGDVRGVLHCHTHYSDGKSSVREMARGAQERGWSYVGISDHSAAAFYAAGIPFNRVVGTSSFVALAAGVSAAALAGTALAESLGMRFPDWLRAVGGNALTAWVLQYVLVYYPAWIAFPSWRRLPFFPGMAAILATTTALSALTVALGRRGIRIPI